jgi:hypothetical protein
MQGGGKVRVGLCDEWQEAGGTGHMGKRKVKSRAWKERSPGMGFQTNGALADAELKKAIQTSRGRAGSRAIGGPEGYLRSAPSRSTMKRQSPSSSPLGGFDLDGLLRPLVTCTARPWSFPMSCPLCSPYNMHFCSSTLLSSPCHQPSPDSRIHPIIAATER